MLIGLISDIHADIDALRAAVELLTERGAEQIVCAGDLVEEGPDGQDVLDFMRQRAIPCVRGNHDDMAIDNQRWLSESLATFSQPRRVEAATRARLFTPEALDFLGGLPDSLRFAWEGVRVVMAHGVPGNNWRYLRASSDPALIRRVASEAEGDVLILGHTHYPMRLNVNGMAIINPGSVCGTHKPGSRTCGMLSLPGREFWLYDLKTGERAEAMRVNID